ncbi:hypothetical protein [Streptomyces erythrochromogenes]|uniref:hypothetical protein n=1 Tax=Streptomyces erythrochromogenes TaxID=285574 RepID=UPI0036F55C84
MATAIIAVLGTLLGALAAGAMQHLVSVSARRDRDRQALAAAVAGLLGAATDHRRHQYLKHAERREGTAPDTPEARAVRWEAKSVMTKALTALTLATDDPVLIRLAGELVTASREVGDPAHDDRPTIPGSVPRANQAHAALRSAAAQHLRRSRR